jgi:hypothetical protein
MMLLGVYVAVSSGRVGVRSQSEAWEGSDVGSAAFWHLLRLPEETVELSR